MRRLPWGTAAWLTAVFVAGLLIVPLATGDWPDAHAAPFVFGAIGYFTAYVQGAARGRKDAA